MKAKVDVYGNNAIGIGLLNRHYNYVILLLQKESNMKDYQLVHKEDPQQFENDKKKLNGQIGNEDVDMEEQNNEDGDKKHRKMFEKKKRQFGGYGSEDEDGYGDEYDEEEEEDYGDEGDVYQEQVFNQQNAFNMNVYGGKSFAQKAPRKSAINYGGFGGPAP